MCYQPVAYQEGLSTSDALLCMFHSLQSALESGQEAMILQIDFSAAIDRANHLGILCVVYIITPILSNRFQHVMVGGCQSKLINVS